MFFLMKTRKNNSDRTKYPPFDVPSLHAHQETLLKMCPVLIFQEALWAVE
jgi:hypothetical protein